MIFWCKCGEEICVWPRDGRGQWYVYSHVGGRKTYHTRAGCGPHLLMEGATCRGAAGRWEAVCALHGWHDPDGADCAREFRFTEAES